MFKICLFSAIIISSMASCTVSQNMQYKGVDNFSIADLGNNPKVNVDINLHNPNKTGATIRTMEFTVLIDNQAIGTAGIEDKIRIKRNADFSIPIEVNTSLDKMGGLLSAGLKSFMGDSSVPVGLTGTFTVQKFIFFRKTFAFEYIDELNVAKILKN